MEEEQELEKTEELACGPSKCESFVQSSRLHKIDGQNRWTFVVDKKKPEG
jgi:hypothetical protein